MARRRGDYITTYSGQMFWPLDPRADEVRIEDIAHALAHQCRWSGHTSRFYSVAQHSLAVATQVRHRYRGTRSDILWALLHDASEAYLVDLPAPLKRLPTFAGFRRVERLVMRAIAARFALPWPMPQLVKWADQDALCSEAKLLMPHDSGIDHLWNGTDPMGLANECEPSVICQQFTDEVVRHLNTEQEDTKLREKFRGGVAAS